MQWLQALKKMHKAHSQICQSQHSIWSLDKASGLRVVVLCDCRVWKCRNTPYFWSADVAGAQVWCTVKQWSTITTITFSSVFVDPLFFSRVTPDTTGSLKRECFWLIRAGSLHAGRTSWHPVKALKGIQNTGRENHPLDVIVSSFARWLLNVGSPLSLCLLSDSSTIGNEVKINKIVIDIKISSYGASVL